MLDFIGKQLQVLEDLSLKFLGFVTEKALEFRAGFGHLLVYLSYMFLGPSFNIFGLTRLVARLENTRRICRKAM